VICCFLSFVAQECSTGDSSLSAETAQCQDTLGNFVFLSSDISYYLLQIIKLIKVNCGIIVLYAVSFILYALYHILN